MEKEIIWTPIAEKDFWEIVKYLKESWPEKVLSRFYTTLLLKTKLLKTHPHLGFKSTKHSRFRRTLITRNYMLIYSVTAEHIVIHRLKHTKLK
jgi:addiction module RelE/StbE family toxin